MNKQNKSYQDGHDKIQSEIEKKHARRERKRKPRMKVSGAGVKKLGKIISEKVH